MMKEQDYRKSFTTPARAEAAFENILNISGWWTSSFQGSAGKVGDTFRVTFGDTYVNFKVADVIPGKKIVWQVTDCHLAWLKNKKEWNNTSIVWEISENAHATTIDMTHLGLVPGIECYKDCEAGWNQYVGESLPKLITTGMGVIFEGSRG